MYNKNRNLINQTVSKYGSFRFILYICVYLTDLYGQISITRISGSPLRKRRENIYFWQGAEKHVALTPEEWVRQHFVNYLITEKHYPIEAISNEVTIKLHNTSKRCDTVIFNTMLEPFIIAEYKAPHIEITEEVFQQILRYNMSLHARYLIVSNGLKHICCQIDYTQQTYKFLKEIPTYEEAIK